MLLFLLGELELDCFELFFPFMGGDLFGCFLDQLLFEFGDGICEG